MMHGIRGMNPQQNAAEAAVVQGICFNQLRLGAWQPS